MEKIRNLNADYAKTVNYDFYATRFSESVQKVVPLVQKLSFSVTGEKSSRGHFGKKMKISKRCIQSTKTCESAGTRSRRSRGTCASHRSSYARPTRLARALRAKVWKMLGYLIVQVARNLTFFSISFMVSYCSLRYTCFAWNVSVGLALYHEVYVLHGYCAPKCEKC